ncbi:hypothetical protein [Bacillus pumilus]|uniref:hypothetical protein n=1 Tax=Bacillus pumilus TaxID=1408 RepID=UPI0011A1582B|nr:hypothetical protein [Bacillus pumilus]
MKKLFLKEIRDVAMIDSDGRLVLSLNPHRIVEEKEELGGEVVNVSEVIIRYFKEAFNIDLKWDDIVKETMGEAIFIIPLYKEAEAYFNKNVLKE